MELVQERRVVATLDVADVVHAFDGTADDFVEVSDASEFGLVLRMADRVGPDVVDPRVVGLATFSAQRLEETLYR